MVLENEITWFGATDTHSTTSPPFVSTPEIFLIYHRNLVLDGVLFSLIFI